MSCIFDFTENFYNANIINGFDIANLENSENISQDVSSEITHANTTINSLLEDTVNFDFVSEQSETDNHNLSLESGVNLDDIQGNLIQGNDGSEVLTGTEGQDTFILEFFHNGVDLINDFNVENDNIIIKGVSDNSNVQYDELTGKLSVDGKEIAQLDTGLNFGDDTYEIF